MFSQSPQYKKSPLAEVICQLRFPEILTISANLPVEFQEAIRGDFPIFTQKKEIPSPKISGTPGNLTLENPPAVVNYQFADGPWRVNLTSKFISLSCSRYTDWDAFAGKLDRPLAAFIQIYKPAFFERIGLRYLNFISRSALGLEGIPFSRLIAPCYLGPLAREDILEQNVSRCSVDVEMGLRGGCRAKIHAGPGLVRQPGKEDREIKLVFDMDLFLPGKLPINLSAGALQTLHSQADTLFREACTQELLDAMEPRD